MASVQERTRNNVKAGVFVTFALALGVATIIVLTGAWGKLFEPKEYYTVIYAVTDGVENLKKGAKVMVGGVHLGDVTQVVPMTGERALKKIEVTFGVNRAVHLYDGAEITIGSALIGENAWLEITSVGDPDLGEPAGRQFQGAKGPVLGGLLGDVGTKETEEVVQNILESTRNVRDVTGRIKDDWPTWAEKMSAVMNWAAGATENIDAFVQEGRDALAAYRNVVVDNRQKIDNAVANIETTTENTRAITQRFRDETADQLESLLASGQAGVETAAGLIEDARLEFGLWAPQIRDALASARLTGQQLKLGATEIRRSPWKLLYRPEREEFQHELLYEATRSFAMAASDLKAASESANRIADSRGADVQLDAKTQEMLNELIYDAITRYQKAQERLATVLFTEYGGE
ncbi:MAG: MlaD family protein [Planctomycetota bacterium]|jgi:ABC-type transporter Mla subunit MlaD